jgi:hypothetical protein
MQYHQVLTSAEQTIQAQPILDAPIARQLVSGGPIIGESAKFLWDFEDSDVAANVGQPQLLDATFEGHEHATSPQSVDAVAALTFVTKAAIASRTRSLVGPERARR